MALELRPAGRVVLVLAGLGLAWLGFDRAGCTPASWPHPLPPAVTAPAEPSAPARLAARAGTGFAFASGESACANPARVAVPRFRWAPGAERAGLAAAAVPPVPEAAVATSAAPAATAAGRQDSGAGKVEIEVGAGEAGADAGAVGPQVFSTPDAREALARLSDGGADVAVVTVSELVAAWDVAAARAAPRIAAVVPGAGSGLAVSLRIAGERDLETARIAAVPGSADEYLALGILARAGIERYWLVEARDAEDALSRLGRGEVDAAAAPLPLLEPVVAAGRARFLAGPAPLDPVVWVIAGGGCRPESVAPGGGEGLLDLPAAWAAAHGVRGGAAPAELLGVLDRPLLRALLAAGGAAPGAGGTR